MSALLVLRKLLDVRLEEPARKWLSETSKTIADDVSHARFCALISLASRYCKNVPLDPDPKELAGLERVCEGVSCERWTRLETLRVFLVLSRSDLAEESAGVALEEAFRYADEGELRALYRSLALLPSPERFAWRAGEGCRTNMVSVFEATALDTPYPAKYFDDLAWRQAAIKCVFIDAPLWRMWGLDDRLSPELARMALDLVDERRSAHRPVQPELWLCLGTHGAERGLESLEREFESANSNTMGRQAAAVAMARAGAEERLGTCLETERDPEVAAVMRRALAGETSQAIFREFRND